MRVVAPGELEQRLAGRRVLIDTNVIIYLTDAVQPYVEPARFLMKAIEEGRLSAVVSIISVAEVMYGPLKAGKAALAAQVRRYLLTFPNLGCQPITEEVLQHVGTHEAVQWSKLRTMDALIIGSGLAGGVEAFVSNDARWRKAISPEYLITLEA
jgi:predicted nucleic acid-binding protein